MVLLVLDPDKEVDTSVLETIEMGGVSVVLESLFVLEVDPVEVVEERRLVLEKLALKPWVIVVCVKGSSDVVDSDIMDEFTKLSAEVPVFDDTSAEVEEIMILIVDERSVELLEITISELVLCSCVEELWFKTISIVDDSELGIEKTVDSNVVESWELTIVDASVWSVVVKISVNPLVVDVAVKLSVVDVSVPMELWFVDVTSLVDAVKSAVPSVEVSLSVELSLVVDRFVEPSVDDTPLFVKLVDFRSVEAVVSILLDEYVIVELSTVEVSLLGKLSELDASVFKELSVDDVELLDELLEVDSSISVELWEIDSVVSVILAVSDDAEFVETSEVIVAETVELEMKDVWLLVELMEVDSVFKEVFVELSEVEAVVSVELALDVVAVAVELIFIEVIL